MRAHTEVIFDSDEERVILSNLSRWHGAEGDGDSPVERGGRLVKRHLGVKNVSLTHRQLSDVLEWIIASCSHFDDQIEMAQTMLNAEPEPHDGEGFSLVVNHRQMAQVLIEAAEEAARDLLAASFLITAALKIATPKMEEAYA